MNYLIIGFGLIGQKRAKALLKLVPKKNIHVYDPYKNIEHFNSINSLDNINLNNYKLVIVSVPHNQILKILNLIKNYKNYLLIEKPLCRNSNEIRQIKKLIGSNKCFIGYNHRFYECIMDAKNFLSKKKEKIISISMDFGHGGSPEDFKSWKKDLNLNGGGALFDPGIHLIDLVSFLSKSSKLKVHKSISWKGFWKFGGEEEISVLLSNKYVKMINLNISLCKWKNSFRININTLNHNLIIEGRTGNYGNQTLEIYKRWSWVNNSRKKTVPIYKNISKNDNSFYNEIDNILKKKTSHNCSFKEALINIQNVEKIYAKKNS